MKTSYIILSILLISISQINFFIRAQIVILTCKDITGNYSGQAITANLDNDKLCYYKFSGNIISDKEVQITGDLTAEYQTMDDSCAQKLDITTYVTQDGICEKYGQLILNGDNKLKGTLEDDQLFLSSGLDTHWTSVTLNRSQNSLISNSQIKKNDYKNEDNICSKLTGAWSGKYLQSRPGYPAKEELSCLYTVRFDVQGTSQGHVNMVGNYSDAFYTGYVYDCADFEPMFLKGTCDPETQMLQVEFSINSGVAIHTVKGLVIGEDQMMFTATNLNITIQRD